MNRKLLSLLVAAGVVLAIAWVIHIKSPPPPESKETAPEQLQHDGVRVTQFPEEYRETVERGLDFLIKQQHDDGHWDDDGNRPVAITGLAGLALLMHDSNPKFYHLNIFSQVVRPPAEKTKYSARIGQAVDWLMNQCRSDRGGLIFSGHASEVGDYMLGHGLATIFLAGAFNSEDDKVRAEKLHRVLMRAVQYTEKSQSSRGGWYRTSKMEGHDFDAILPTAIQIQALQAAQNNAIPTRGGSSNDGYKSLMDWLENDVSKAKRIPTAADNRTRLIDFAAALACRVPPRAWGWGVQIDNDEKWPEACLAQFPRVADMTFDRDEMLHYYYAQAVRNDTRKTRWLDFRTALFQHLKSSQRPNGSWPVGAESTIGAVEAAAIWGTLLQLDHDRHPSKDRAPVDIN